MVQQGGEEATLFCPRPPSPGKKEGGSRQPAAALRGEGEWKSYISHKKRLPNGLPWPPAGERGKYRGKPMLSERASAGGKSSSMHNHLYKKD